MAYYFNSLEHNRKPLIYLTVFKNKLFKEKTTKNFDLFNSLQNLFSTLQK